MRVLLMLVASAYDQVLLTGRCLQKQLAEVLSDIQSTTFVIPSFRLLCLVLCMCFHPFQLLTVSCL